MISLDFLEKVEVFKGLDDEQLTAVQACCQEKGFKQGDKLFNEGEDAAHLYAVIEGQVDLKFDSSEGSDVDKSILSSVTEAKAFGWSSLVPPYKLTLSCYCASRNCKVAEVDSKQLIGLFEKDNVLGYRVMSNLSELVGRRFNNLQNEIAKRRGEEMMSNW
ncbi:cyclic nucleotide-binding domain-containing protein [Desulfococcaceae bacterium HSG8]|nr:cyclic nucleotide-binding domain-containing protein [Desulfococcaceae bacterium HSG8]